MKAAQINHKSPLWHGWKVGVVGVFVLHLAFLFANQKAQAVPDGGYAHPELLIQPEALKNLIDTQDPNLRMIDIRQKLKYLGGHIPGAVHVWRPDIIDKDHPVRGMMASKGQVEDLLGNLGVSEKNTVVIYSDGPDNGRLWWILAYYGYPLNQMRLLDGGIEAWKRKGYPTDMSPPSLEKTRFKFEPKVKAREPLLCNLQEIKEALKDQRKVVLDVRSEKEFLGEETKSGAAKPGRIPGVKWIEWTEALVGEGPYKGYWKPAEEIRRVFSAKGVTPDKEIFMY
jgi:thiosulfate/3-mercaptopyruvate sulfurtransferase